MCECGEAELQELESLATVDGLAAGDSALAVVGLAFPAVAVDFLSPLSPAGNLVLSKSNLLLCARHCKRCR